MIRKQRCLTMMLLMAATSGAIIGCSKADVKDYVPADELARKSLAAALDAWKAGKATDAIGAADPAVNAQDTLWQSGKKLQQYEIIGPEKGDDLNLRFRVRLTLAGETAPKEVVYVVLGKDPIWVFSEEDYGKTSGM